MQGWGGPDGVAKADALIRDVLTWFYDNKGACTWVHLAVLAADLSDGNGRR